MLSIRLSKKIPYQFIPTMPSDFRFHLFHVKHIGWTLWLGLIVVTWFKPNYGKLDV